MDSVRQSWEEGYIGFPKLTNWGKSFQAKETRDDLDEKDHTGILLKDKPCHQWLEVLGLRSHHVP